MANICEKCFQIHFLERKFMYFDENLTKFARMYVI